MIGYARNGYRLYDEDTKKVVIRRNVIFDEKERKEIQNNVELECREVKEEDVNKDDNEENDNEEFYEAEDTLEKDDNSKENSEKEQIVREKRIIRKPKWQQDYVTDFEGNENEVMYALMAGQIEDTPHTFEEIDKREDSELWRNAVKEEFNVLEDSGTWRKVERKRDMKLLDTKWFTSSIGLESKLDLQRTKPDSTLPADLFVKASQQRRKRKSVVLTDTPEKESLRMEYEEKMKKKQKKDDKGKEKGKGKQKGKGKKSAKNKDEIERVKKRVGRVNVEHQRVHVADFSRFVQCRKCLQFGHTGNKCEAEFYPCAHCGSAAHHISTCSHRTDPTKMCCYNCKQTNSTYTKHSALDTKVCPKILKAQKSLNESTDYGY
ncbi:uncharacterized protein LOC128678904 [Plodia interpunctella]|uniref:uncharacterized protein LOC128678904 n=1 Tax=Plodia interpunctella TaxID=58824 RepID=UPI00236873FE|nr:uncharacterized protein LOC128678904 [Plodia interpunctella]